VTFPHRLLSCLLHLSGLLACVAAQAGNFTVQPMRLELGGTARSTALTVRNDEPQAQSFSVRAMAWRQDDAGQDHYEDATDLVYFPRLLTVEAGQEAVVRVGVRQGSGALERSYRLFLEELPPTLAPQAGGGAQVRMLVRFGAPLFVRPLQPRRELAVEGLALAEGQVRWELRNTGNRHERLEQATVRGLDAAGAERFSQPVEARYLLAGTRRRFAIALPPGACQGLARIALAVRTDLATQDRHLDLAAPACP
jgi:fimbrial chaperone protein